MGDERPLPLADETSEGFWQAAREGRLAIQRCDDCRGWNHAPSLACPRCGSFALTYEQVSGNARLHSWTVIAEPPAPGFVGRLPLIVGVVELAEQDGLLMVANLLDAAPAEMQLGMSLTVTFEALGEGHALPQFRPAKG